MPEASDLVSSLRKDETKIEWMFDLFGSTLVGSTHWKKYYTRIKISDFVAVSEEAFLLLCFENYELVWKAKAKKKVLLEEESGGADGKREDEAKTQWTQGRAEEGKNTGWAKGGMDRFDQLGKIVMASRTEYNKVSVERGETVEMKLLKKWREKLEPKKTKKKKIVRKEDIHFIDTSLV